jgi:hypothetical protein
VGYNNMFGWGGMKSNRIVCNEHPDFSVVSINSGLADIINHCFMKHSETVKDMDFVSMFREEEDK